MPPPETPEQRAERIAGAAAAAPGPTTPAETPAQRAERIAGAASVSIRPAGGQSPYDTMIRDAATKHGVDPDIYRRLIQRESNFNPQAVSPKGARGLAQLMPGTAAGLGVKDPHDPAQAIDAGARYLRQQMDSFGNVRHALAAYNAGPGAVQKFKGAPPYAETQAYVNAIAGPARDLGEIRRGLSHGRPAGNETPEQRAARIAGSAPVTQPQRPAAPAARELMGPGRKEAAREAFLDAQREELARNTPIGAADYALFAKHPKPLAPRPGETRLPTKAEQQRAQAEREKASPIAEVLGRIGMAGAYAAPKSKAEAQAAGKAASGAAGKAAELPFSMLLPNMHRILAEEPEKINDGTALEQAFVKDFAILRAGNQAESLVGAIPALQKVTASLQGAAKTKFTQALARVFSPAQMAANFAGGATGQALLDAPEKLTPQERAKRIGQGGVAATAFGGALRVFSKGQHVAAQMPNGRVAEGPVVRHADGRVTLKVDSGQITVPEATVRLAPEAAPRTTPEPLPKAPAPTTTRGPAPELEAPAPAKATPPSRGGLKKNVWELTPEELDAAIEIQRDYEHNAARDIFGEAEGARYEALHRRSGSAQASRAEQDAAQAALEEMERGLTEAQRQRLYGGGESGPQLEDLRQVRRAIDAVDESSPEAAGASLRAAAAQIPTDPNPANWTTREHAAMAQIMHAGRAAERNGWSRDQVLTALREAVAERHPDSQDAALIWRNFEQVFHPEGSPAHPAGLPAPAPIDAAAPAPRAAESVSATTPDAPSSTAPSSTAPSTEPEKYAGAINLHRLDVDPRVKELIQETYSGNKQAQDASRRSPRSWEETDAAGKKLIEEGVIHPDVFKDAKTGKAYNAEEIDALRQVHGRLWQDVRDAEAAYRSSDTAENLARLLEATTRAQAVMHGLQGASAEAGRALNIHKRIRQAWQGDIPPEAAKDMFDPAKAPETATSTKAEAGQTKSVKADFGAANVLFRREAAEAAKQRIREKLAKAGRANMALPGGPPAIDPTIVADLVEYGGYLVEGGVRQFGTWAKQMRADLGDHSEAQLREVWRRLRGEAQKRVTNGNRKDLLRKKLMDVIGEEGLPEDLVARIAKIPEDDPAAMMRLLQETSKFTPGQKFMSFYRANLLSGPKTHLRNFVGNAIQGGLQNVTRYVSAAVDVPVAAVTGRERQFGGKDAIAGTLGYLQGFPEGLAKGLTILKHGYTSQEAAALELPGYYEFSGVAAPLNAPGRLLAASDALFRTMAFEAERAALATRKALNAKTGKSGMLEALNSEEVLAAAEKQASRATFTEEPDEVLQSLMRLRSKALPLQFVIPFVKTPYNILKETGRYSPAGLARLAKLKPDDPEVTRVISEALVGSGILAGVGAFVQGTDITASAPTERNARDAFFRSGRQAYAVRIGGRWYSYASMGPITSLLSAAAAWKADYWRRKQSTPADQFWRMSAEIGKSFTDASFLSGLTSLMNAVQDPERFAERQASGMASGLIPLSALLRNVAQATDPTMRKTEGALEDLQAQIPGASRLLPPRVDALGADVKRQPDGLGQLQPLVGAPASRNPITNELNRLRIFPALAPEKLTIDSQEIKLTKSEATEYARRLGTATRDAAARFIAAPDYPKWSDERRIDSINRAVRKAREAATDIFKRKLREQRGLKRGPRLSAPPAAGPDPFSAMWEEDSSA